MEAQAVEVMATVVQEAQSEAAVALDMEVALGRRAAPEDCPGLP